MGTPAEILVSVLLALGRFVGTLRRSHCTVRCLQIPLSCSIQKPQQNFHLETELDAINFGEGKRRNEFVEWHVAWLAE